MVEKNHLLIALRRYFVNLLTAISGKNPYRMELDCLRQINDKNTEDVCELKKMYCICVEKLDESVKQIKGLQTLVENLRVRIAEKENLVELVNYDYQKRIREMKENYQRQIDLYVKEISELQKRFVPSMECPENL